MWGRVGRHLGRRRAAGDWVSDPRRDARMQEGALGRLRYCSSGLPLGAHSGRTPRIACWWQQSIGSKPLTMAAPPVLHGLVGHLPPLLHALQAARLFPDSKVAV